MSKNAYILQKLIRFFYLFIHFLVYMLHMMEKENLSLLLSVTNNTIIKNLRMLNLAIYNGLIANSVLKCFLLLLKVGLTNQKYIFIKNSSVKFTTLYYS